jgi:hypothetical protein
MCREDLYPDAICGARGQPPPWSRGPLPHRNLIRTLVTYSEIGEHARTCQERQRRLATWQDCEPPLLFTYPQPRSSTARQALTSEFSRIIHRPVHKALSWLVKGCR